MVKNLQRGERGAFKHFVLTYSSLFFTKAKMYCRNTQDAEDTLQDAFVTIYQKLPEFKGDNTNAFISWSCKIVINTALSKYRRMYFTKERTELTEQTDIHIDPSVYSSIGQEELMNLVNKLPEGYKQIFSLYAIEGYSHKEIADLISIKESTSRSQYIRAKRKLKDMMTASSPINMVS